VDLVSRRGETRDGGRLLAQVRAKLAQEMMARILVSRATDLRKAKEQQQASAAELSSRAQQIRLELEAGRLDAAKKDTEAGALKRKEAELQERINLAAGDERMRDKLNETRTEVTS